MATLRQRSQPSTPSPSVYDSVSVTIAFHRSEFNRYQKIADAMGISLPNFLRMGARVSAERYETASYLASNTKLHRHRR